MRSPPENGNGGRSQFGTSSPPFIRVYGNAVEVLKVCATDPYIKKLDMQNMVRDINARDKILKSPNGSPRPPPGPPQGPTSKSLKSLKSLKSPSPTAPVVAPNSPQRLKSPPNSQSPSSDFETPSDIYKSPSDTSPTATKSLIYNLFNLKTPSPP